MDIEFKSGNQVEFTHTNHKGLTLKRTVICCSVEFGIVPLHGPEPVWFLRAYCLDRQAYRSFTLKDIQNVL